MRYVVTLLVLLAIVVVGCKKPQTGPVTTVEPPPRTLEPIPPAEPSPPDYPPPSPVMTSPPPRPLESPAPPAAGNTYTVQKGDTPWSIAKKLLGDGHRWREIYDANPGLDPDPSKLKAGQVIVIPTK